MAKIVVSAERTVEAPADAVYRYVSDMREHHPRYLPAAFSDFHAVNLGEPIVSGNRTAQEWKVTGTNDGELMGIPPTGKQATTYGCGTAEFGDDGLIHRAGNYWNAAALMQQLGVVPDTVGANA